MNQSRRQFLNHSLAVAGLGAASGFALNLATIGSAAAQTANADYKALVCLFMYGGNDQYNTFLPYDNTSYNSYFAIRNIAPTSIAIEKGRLLLLNPSMAGNGRQLAAAPSLSNIKNLYDQGKVAIVPNVGPLLMPTTKAQYNSANHPLPPKLFSHNDQQATWQTFGPEGTTTGWAGRMGDLLMANNGNPALTCINSSAIAPFLNGLNASQYRVSPTGAIAINAYNEVNFGVGPDALKNIISNNKGSKFMQQDYVDITNRSINLQQAVNSALSSSPSLALPNDLAGNNLAQQFRIVARLIAANSSLGTKRQVFFVSMGGFDTHDNESSVHPNLLTSIDKSVNYFYNSLTSIGLQNNVTTFSASDFGRTLTSNGDGTDHAWGSHHFVVGGAVKGKDIYGQIPEVGINTNDDVGSGRLIPTTSVEQYAQPLAKWMGLSDSQIREIFPRIGNFGIPKNFMI